MVQFKALKEAQDVSGKHTRGLNEWGINFLDRDVPVALLFLYF